MGRPQTITLTLLILISSVFPVACTSSPQDAETKKTEEILENAFEAIQNNDWPQYQRLLITTADFDMKARGVSRINSNRSFTGGVLKLQLIEKQKTRFESFTNSEDIGYHISGAQYKGVGTLLEQGTIETLQAGMVPYKAYSLKLKIDGEILDTKEYGPIFALVEFNGWYKIIHASLPAN
jgi:hypothetical protein